MQPTTQQQQIIDVANQGETILISAFAGSGKTTTLVMLAQALAPKRGLYLAYNKAMQLQAYAKFPKNVHCLTIHALAYRALGHHYKDQLPLRLTTDLIINYYQLKPLKFSYDQADVFASKGSIAAHAKAIVNHFCISEETEISLKHQSYRHIRMLTKRYTYLPKEFSKQFVVQYLKTALDLAGRLWKDMQDINNHTIPMDHEGYLKCYQLKNPKFGQYDFIMLDEAQDANPPIIKLLAQQTNTQRIYVGDPYQQIYAWRGSVNAMEQLQGNQLYLTQSFRFGQAIADEANKILKKLDCQQEIMGNPQIDSKIGEINLQSPYTVIGRTNGCLFSSILTHESQHRPMAWVGNLAEVLYTFWCGYYLWIGQTDKIRHPMLSQFNTWVQLKKEAQLTQDLEIKSIIDFIGTYGDSTPQQLEKLKQICNYPEDQAEIIFTTAHKAKGRQWQQVALLDDFRHEKKIPEEMNLWYVAITRAIHACASLNLEVSQEDSINLKRQDPSKITKAPVDLEYLKAKQIISLNPSLSKKALVNKLNKRGISRTIIDKLCMYNEGKELSNACQLVHQKLKTVKAQSDFERSQKLLRFLLSKGFNYDLAKSAVANVIKEQEQTTCDS